MALFANPATRLHVSRRPSSLHGFSHSFGANGAVGRSISTSPDLPAERAIRYVHLGGLSAACQAIDAAPLVSANQETLRQLTDPSRRPVEPYGPLGSEILDFQPDAPVALDRTALLANLRARKGAAPAPTGLTAEMLRLVLDAEESSQAFRDVAVLLARASVPEPIAAALAIGRLVAVRKPNGGIRGLVVGDFLRRVVARTLAQQFATHFQRACLPHQHAFTTRAGSEALVHALQARAQLDPRLTLVSVDVTAAYDLISREAMLQALRRTPEASALLPFMRLWYARASPDVWVAGPEVHRITQAEGGEQGGPLMPAVFSLGIAPALSALQHELR